MEKEFVPYKLALRMKALGFDFIVIAWSDVYTNHIIFMSPDNWCDMNKHKECISRPTFSQCFRWFREKYDLHAVIMPKITPSNTTVYYSYKGKIEKDWNNCFESYEEAETDCLEKLIEIVESKSE